MLVPLLALSLAASASAAPVVKDLSPQFPDAALRDQGATGSCHVFTTISLIEAALYRRYGLRMPLSEADLFARKVLSDPAYYGKARAAVNAGDGAASAYTFIEGGSPYDDLEFARTHGVAKAATAPWSAFAARYDAYRKERKKEIEPKRETVVASAGAMKQVRDDSAEIGRLEQSGMADRTAQIAQVNLQRVGIEVEQFHRANLKDFRSFLDQIAGKSKDEADALLLGDPAKLAADRASVKAMIVPFRVRKLDFKMTPLDPKAADPDAACKKDGVARKAGLLAALGQGIPVTVAMNVGGLKEWGIRNPTAWHAFTITGYERDAAGEVTLKSRNSWGGDNPAVAESRFCRISRIVAVLTDKE